MAYGSGFGDPKVARYGNFIYMTGMIRSGTVTDGTIVFNLPTGYRPAQTQHVAAFAFNNGTGTGSACTLKIETNGDVKVYYAVGNSWITLNSVVVL
ncbi:MAG: hypothetical protein ACOYK8_00550 [Alphaproteobacteria bacterium]